MEELNKLKKDMIVRYEMALALIGDEICKEIDSKLPDDLYLMRKKAICYCECFKSKKDINDEQLKEKCLKYLAHVICYKKLK